MTVRRTLLLGNGLLLLLLFAQVGLRYARRPADQYQASWRDRPATLEETTRLATEVVQAKVARIRKAKPLRVRMNVEPGRADTIPVEVVTLELVSDADKGRGKKGERIEVFHTGHSDAMSPAARKDKPSGTVPAKPPDGVDEANAVPSGEDPHMGVLFSGVMDDPAYAVGEEYVLFLRAGPELEIGTSREKTIRIVAPEGRYKIENGTLTPMSTRDFAKELKGKPPEELRRKVRGH